MSTGLMYQIMKMLKYISTSSIRSEMINVDPDNVSLHTIFALVFTRSLCLSVSLSLAKALHVYAHQIRQAVNETGY